MAGKKEKYSCETMIAAVINEVNRATVPGEVVKCQCSAVRRVGYWGQQGPYSHLVKQSETRFWQESYQQRTVTKVTKALFPPITVKCSNACQTTLLLKAPFSFNPPLNMVPSTM